MDDPALHADALGDPPRRTLVVMASRRQQPDSLDGITAVGLACRQRDHGRWAAALARLARPDRESRGLSRPGDRCAALRLGLREPRVTKGMPLRRAARVDALAAPMLRCA